MWVGFGGSEVDGLQLYGASPREAQGPIPDGQNSIPGPSTKKKKKAEILLAVEGAGF